MLTCISCQRRSHCLLVHLTSVQSQGSVLLQTLEFFRIIRVTIEKGGVEGKPPWRHELFKSCLQYSTFSYSLSSEFVIW